MTETEWLACTDPQKMLEFLRGKASDRKLRLFAVACCRSIWRSLKNPESRKAVEVAEQFADGLATSQDMAGAAKKARELAGLIGSAYFQLYQERYLSSDEASEEEGNGQENQPERERVEWREGAAVQSASWAVWHKMTVFQATRGLRAAQQASPEPTREGAHQSTIIHDIFGNPFRPIALAPSWLAWSDGTVGKLAQGIYDERAFDRLPVLADALEEAGCADADVLSHCRGPGPHVRGCWVVDLILGKQ
jgi:hypothetical protein